MAEERSKLYVEAMLEAFSERVREYHSSTALAEDRIKRAERIREVLRTINVAELTLNGSDYGCQIDEHCVDGACVKNSSFAFEHLREDQPA